MKTCLLLLLFGTCFAVSGNLGRADEPAVPSLGREASHFVVLWTKSPFAVGTGEPSEESPDYILGGIAQFDGVDYASLVEKKSNEHFLLVSDKTIRGLRLLSIFRGQNGSGAVAVVQKGDEAFTLRAELPPLMAKAPAQTESKAQLGLFSPGHPPPSHL